MSSVKWNTCLSFRLSSRNYFSMMLKAKNFEELLTSAEQSVSENCNVTIFTLNSNSLSSFTVAHQLSQHSWVHIWFEHSLNKTTFSIQLSKKGPKRNMWSFSWNHLKYILFHNRSTFHGIYLFEIFAWEAFSVREELFLRTYLMNIVRFSNKMWNKYRFFYIFYNGFSTINVSLDTSKTQTNEIVTRICSV